MAYQEILTYTNGAGTVVNLTTQAPGFYKAGMGGRMMPPIEMSTESIPGEDGARSRQVRYLPRVIDIDCQVVGATRQETLSKLADIARSLSPKLGFGSLRVTREDGSARELACILAGGMADTGNGGEDERVVPLTLTFRAMDPYWYSVSTTTASFSSEGATNFFPFGFPFTVSSSAVFATASATNTGDVEAWPMWTIEGPGAELVLSNITTGKSLSMNHTFAAGELLIIDTAPGAKTVISGAGTNLYGSLNNTSSLWALAPGLNSIGISMVGTSADTRVSVEWHQRYVAT